MTTTRPIPLDELPSELRALAIQMQRVGGAIAYFGGFGPFAEWGRLLTDQSAPMCSEIAGHLERMRGGNA